MYERTETGLQRRTFNTAQLAQSFDGYAQVERNDRGGITITPLYSTRKPAEAT